jgi:membrane protein
MKSLKNRLQKNSVYAGVTGYLKRTSLPGFQGVPIYTVLVFLLREIEDEDMQLRGSSLAFNFFIALFPAIIFLFTLIPYIPISGLQEQILSLFRELLPATAFAAASATLEDILGNQRGGLLSLGFFMALYFSTNGIHAMMNAFNKYNLSTERRTQLRQRITSVGLTFLVGFVLLFSILLITFSELVMNWITSKDIISAPLVNILIIIIRWLITMGLLFLIFSSLYFYGPSRKRRWRFITPGSTLATGLSLLATIGFTAYVNQFNSYNKLYGSIGTLLVVMIIIYFNSLILLIGFELNASIDKSIRARNKELKVE